MLNLEMPLFFCLQHTKSGTVNRKGRSPGRGVVPVVSPPLRAGPVLLRSPGHEARRISHGNQLYPRHSTNFN